MLLSVRFGMIYGMGCSQVRRLSTCWLVSSIFYDRKEDVYCWMSSPEIQPCGRRVDLKGSCDSQPTWWKLRGRARSLQRRLEVLEAWSKEQEWYGQPRAEAIIQKRDKAALRL